jgi:uncharacterized protein
MYKIKHLLTIKILLTTLLLSGFTGLAGLAGLSGHAGNSGIAGIFGLSDLQAQDLPVPPKPSGWVNDYASVFSQAEAQQLSNKLNRFQYNHSTQIFIVTLNDNNGYPASTLAPMIGEAWGVGQRGKDNGLIILMDMKTRDVFISTGYGLEEYIPDAIAKRIVEKEVIPAFREGNFYRGINSATDVIASLLEGKFTPDQYREQTAGSDAGSAIGGIIFLIIMVIFFIGGSRRRAYGAGGRRGSSLPLWIALGMLSGSRSRGSFGNFSSGSGSFGGGFGGFTGGGGGSFGGGGAGGSW